MKRSLALLLPSLLLVVAVIAQGTHQHSKTQAKIQAEIQTSNIKTIQSLPTVEQILERHLQAIGGAAAWRKLTSRRVKATFEIQDDKATVSLESYAQAPNKRVNIMHVKAGEELAFDISRGFDGRTGWSLNLTEGGFRELEGVELAAEKRDAEFHHELKLKELYPKMSRVGQVAVDGHQTYCIEATPREGQPEKWYFDLQTGLLVRLDSISETASEGKKPDETYYEDYREVDGIKLPFTIRQPGSKTVIKITEVKHNLPIEEAKFKNPGAAFEALSTFKVRHSSQPVAERGVLYLSLEPAGDQISVRAELDGKKIFHLLDQRAEMTRQLRALYILLESEKANKEELYPLLEKFGDTFFAPIADLMDAAAEIQFIIPGKFLLFPLDLFHFKGQPLFLQKPVSYSFEKLAAGQFLFSPPERALIIEDPAVNPQKCCQMLKDVLPSSGYYNTKEMNLTKLSSQPSADLLLISAHGYIGYAQTDYLKIGEERLQPEHLAHLSPKLVWLDACALGASASFIESFRERGTKFYLAPLFSNEAGNSSTKTIAYFFERLKAGDTPSRALFFTRKKLYQVFGEKEGFAKLLFRAFPFRVYVLN